MLTYGLTDAYTSARMMELKGFQIESNPIIIHIYMAQGFLGVIAAKLIFTFIALFSIYLIQHYASNIYWKVNGFLIITSLFGLMAGMANMKAAEGRSDIFPGIFFDPTYFSIIYIVSLIISMIIGDFFDRKKTDKL